MAKKNKTKLPKKMFGVKIPKAVRKGPLGDFLGSERGQALIRDAALALMAAGAVGAAESPKGRKLEGEIGHMGAGIASAAGHQAGHLQHALIGAIEHFIAAFREGSAKKAEDGPPPEMKDADGIRH